MKYILGLLVVALGAIMVIKSTWFVTNFGSSSWAEEHLGSGGTYTFYKLLGIVFIFASFMYMTGILGSTFMSIFGGLFVF